MPRSKLLGPGVQTAASEAQADTKPVDSADSPQVEDRDKPAQVYNVERRAGSNQAESAVNMRGAVQERAKEHRRLQPAVGKEAARAVVAV